MEINLGNLKIERAVTVTFYILSVVLPFCFGLIVYDSSIFMKMDIFKLLLMSISITGSTILFNFIVTTITLVFIKAVSKVLLKEKLSRAKLQADTVENLNKEEIIKDTTGEMALYLTFFLNDLAASITILNLIRLKYYLHLSSNLYINASINTYLLVCLIWYSMFFVIFMILNIGFYYVIRQKVTENKMAFYLMRAFLEKKKKEKSRE